MTTGSPVATASPQASDSGEIAKPFTRSAYESGMPTTGQPPALPIGDVEGTADAVFSLFDRRPRNRDEVPAWVPNGTRLAFQSDRTGRMEIWTMNADGSKPRQVTR